MPIYTDIDKLVRETASEIGVVSVNYHANGEVGLMAVEAGLHLLLETLIAHKLPEGDAIIAAARERSLRIEIAEQFHRRPLEQVQLKLSASGLFSPVHTAFNDFAGHGYHGVSVLGSDLGFDAKPLQVNGMVRQYDLAPHWVRLSGTRRMRTETQEHGVIKFQSGQIGILRWWRSSQFLAEKGMGITVGVGLDLEERLSLISPGGEAPRFITIERRWERIHGGALAAMVAHTGDPDLPVVQWDNPFRPAVQGHGTQWHADEIGVAGCLLSLVGAVRNGTEPTYGADQGRLDQELILALRMSSLAGGQPIKLPLDPQAQTI